jgi:hypothetical protein
VFAPKKLKFCPACGQETHTKPPTLGEFAQQFGGQYIAAEGALWRTLGLLLFRPGVLTRNYLAGQRRRYVLPLRMYLTISVLVLILLRSVASGIETNGPAVLQTEPSETVVFDAGIGKTGLKNGHFFCTDFPDWLCKRLKNRYDVDPKLMERESKALGERMLSNLGSAMFVLLPWFALWMRAVYFNRKLQYTEHLVFALHVHTFWFAMLGLALLKIPVVSGLAFLAIPVYTLLAMKVVFGGSRWRRLLRAAIVTIFYFMMFAVAMAGLGLWAIVF